MDSLQQEVIRLGDIRVSREELMKEFRELSLKNKRFVHGAKQTEAECATDLAFMRAVFCRK
jgi:hypothetical protein